MGSEQPAAAAAPAPAPAPASFRNCRRSSSGIFPAPARAPAVRLTVLLVMTGGAILRRLVAPVTIDAPAHFELLRGQEPRPPDRVLHERELVVGLDGAVARLAREASLHVGAVLELHVLRQPVDLHPLDRLLLGPVILQRADAL